MSKHIISARHDINQEAKSLKIALRVQYEIIMKGKKVAEWQNDRMTEWQSDISVKDLTEAFARNYFEEIWGRSEFS